MVIQGQQIFCLSAVSVPKISSSSTSFSWNSSPQLTGLIPSRRNGSLNLRRKQSAIVKQKSSSVSGCRCEGQAWFEFSTGSSSEKSESVRMGDFKILSHLKQLGCGDLKQKPLEVHFPGCMNEAYAFLCTGGDFFVKINRRIDVDSMFEGEHEALARMKATDTIRVPAPLGCGSLSDGGSYLIMEHLHFRPFGMLKSSSQDLLGTSLAKLHLADVGSSCGFGLPTRLGMLSLSNSWSSSWSEFFIEKRLRERFRRSYPLFKGEDVEIEKLADLVLERAVEILKDRSAVRPSLLHGDLWMGNTGLVASGEVAIFDPACYIGDSEFDLAFQDWIPSRGFPGFQDGFYRAYHELLPRAPGFEERHNVYQLYHLLNHLLIYRGEYLAHVMVAIDRVLRG